MKQGEALRITSITREEFDKVAVKAMEKASEEALEHVGPHGMLLSTLVGAVFTKHLRDQLFPEEVGEDATNSAR